MIKPKQLKKLSVGMLKLVIQEYEIGKVSRKRKQELIDTILNSEKAAQILDDIDPEILVKPKRQFSKKQLENQRKFAERARARKGTKQPRKPKAPKAPKASTEGFTLETAIAQRNERQAILDNLSRPKTMKAPKVRKPRVKKSSKMQMQTEKKKTPTY